MNKTSHEPSIEEGSITDGIQLMPFQMGPIIFIKDYYFLIILYIPVCKVSSLNISTINTSKRLGKIISFAEIRNRRENSVMPFLGESKSWKYLTPRIGQESREFLKVLLKRVLLKSIKIQL